MVLRGFGWTALDGFGRLHEFKKPLILLIFGQLGRLGRLLFFLKKGIYRERR
jgi:hypothetical protein